MALKKQKKGDYLWCEDWHADKKMKIGFLLFLVGFLWYANETGILGITVEHFWPDMLMLLGVLFILKGFLLKSKK